MQNRPYVAFLDEATLDLLDLKKLLFVAECCDLMRRGELHNIDFDRVYTEDMLTLLSADVVSHMKQKLGDFEDSFYNLVTILDDIYTNGIDSESATAVQ